MRVTLRWGSGQTTETEVSEPMPECLIVPRMVFSRDVPGWFDHANGRTPLPVMSTFVLIRRVVNGEVVCEYYERP